MAKHQGLGRGLEALMQGAEDDYSSVNNTQAEKESTGVQIKGTVPSAPKTNLPAGISADENGTLWCDPKLLKPNPYQPRTHFDEEYISFAMKLGYMDARRSLNNYYGIENGCHTVQFDYEQIMRELRTEKLQRSIDGNMGKLMKYFD